MSLTVIALNCTLKPQGSLSLFMMSLASRCESRS